MEAIAFILVAIASFNTGYYLGKRKQKPAEKPKIRFTQNVQSPNDILLRNFYEVAGPVKLSEKQWNETCEWCNLPYALEKTEVGDESLHDLMLDQYLNKYIPEKFWVKEAIAADRRIRFFTALLGYAQVRSIIQTFDNMWVHEIPDDCKEMYRKYLKGLRP